MVDNADQGIKHLRLMGQIYSILCTVFAGVAVAQNTEVASSQTRKPNIILILADDLGYADLGCYGNPHVQTPHLDRMALEGVRFTDFHSNGSMCTPTRAAILTGKYQQRVGVDGVGDRLNKDAVTIAQRLRDDAGYRTAIYGKWHLSGHNRRPEDYLGRKPMDFGFDEFRGFMSGFIDYINHHTDAGDLDWWHNDKLIEERGYASHLLVDHALDFIRESKDGPFFLYLSFPEPHFPFMTPDDPAYFQPGETYPTAGDPERSRLGPYDGKDELQSVFYRMVHEMDRGIGKVIETLEKHGLADNTFIFFTSDNGGYVYYRQLTPETQRFDGATDLNYGRMSDNGPYRGQKAELYEGGHRVPAIAWWPGRVFPAKVTDELTMTFDLVPTFLEIAGIALSSDRVQHALDGISLYPLLTQRSPLPPRRLYWLFRGEGAVRYGDWKFIRHKGEPVELYNLGVDPQESINVAADHADITDQLQDGLNTFEKLMKQTCN